MYSKCSVISPLAAQNLNLIQTIRFRVEETVGLELNIIYNSLSATLILHCMRGLNDHVVNLGHVVLNSNV